MAETRYRIVTDPVSSEVEVKKSRFIGELRTVRSEEEAKAFLAEVRKEHREARHHCFAMRIGEPGKEAERFSDDGEPQGTAGKPVLALLQGEGLTDVCAVVTRYFGGTLLGTGGLVRAYSDAAREAVRASGKTCLREGARVCVTADYALANRIRYLAQSMELFAEKEEFSDVCALYYLAEAEKLADFAGKVSEMSGGRAGITDPERLLFWSMNGKPVVYKKL